jgi:hypothetical protein
MYTFSIKDCTFQSQQMLQVRHELGIIHNTTNDPNIIKHNTHNITSTIQKADSTIRANAINHPDHFKQVILLRLII